jgi:starch synthase
MLGGEQGLRGVMRAAKQNRVKVVVDSLARISSSRHHRKYKKLLLNYLDEDGRRHICYGTDGQAQKFEDTAMLNYRKLESWELLIDEVISYAQKFGVDGIHLDNGQAWPQIMEPDVEELTRIDVDGQPAYTAEDFMNGELVLRNENHGYWNSNNMETYPNPFFIKMCKKLWLQNSDFMIIGECWGGFMFEHRQIILARSGVIPRLFKLPVALSAIMGKKLHNDGRLENCERQTVVGIKQWYEDSRRFLPDGTILMQSSTSHTLPLPAYLYGQGTWAAIDTLFFMPDLPITFMGELEGEVYKVGEVATVFQQDQASTSVHNPGELRRTNSQIMRALKDGEELTQASTDQNPVTPPAPEQRRGLPKVRSGVNIAQIYVEAKEGQIMQKE